MNNRTVAPFKHFCVSIGALPSSYLESMTYYELLAWFCKFLSDDVIPAINNNADAVTELQNKFTELKTYVDNYFTNLDVQNEINNKLDQMAEDGTLAEIVNNFMNIAKVINTVDEMLTSPLANNQKIKTLGYHEINDGGGGDWYITNTPIEGSYQIQVGNLYATLILSNNMSVKQFGAYGDNEHDDTNAFNAINSLCQTINIPVGSYMVETLVINNDKIVNGNGATINANLIGDTLISFGNNCIINNLNINSNNENKEWNRIDITGKNNIIFNNCSFSGFRQTEPSPSASGLNVWALYIKQSSNIKLNNCNFSDNSYQDILIEYSSENISISNCGNINPFWIDIEPGSNTNIDNVLIENCILKELDIVSHQNNYVQISNVLVNSSTINNFQYAGGNVTLNECNIKSYSSTSDQYGVIAGNLKLNNSALFSDNMIKDPYFGLISQNNPNSFWIHHYSDGGTFTNLVNLSKDTDGYISLKLNPNNQGVFTVIKSQKIACKPSTPYLIKTLCKAFMPSGSTSPNGRQMQILYYNFQDTLISTDHVNINQGPTDEELPYQYKSRIFTTPNTCTYFIIQFRNSDISGSSFSLDLRNCALYELLIPSANNEKNNIPDLPPIKNYELSSPVTPDATFLNHIEGTRIYFNPVGANLGAVCINDGSYKNFGNLA